NNKTEGKVQYEIINPPIHGTINLNSQTGEVVYTPPLNFSGVDEFSYIAINKNGKSSPATVRVEVINGDIPPQGVDSTFLSFEENEEIVILPYSDANGDLA